MSDVKKYLLEDIEKLEHDDICKLYKYVRRYLIANTGMLDPLERSDNSEYVAQAKSCPRCNSTQIMQFIWDGSYECVHCNHQWT